MLIGYQRTEIKEASDMPGQLFEGYKDSRKYWLVSENIVEHSKRM
jgi:hypothetical protein